MRATRVLGVLAIATMLSGSSCIPINQHPANMSYVHVADAKEVRFSQPVNVGGYFPINKIDATNNGYWAIFWICRLGVDGPADSYFHFDPRTWSAVGAHEYPKSPMVIYGTSVAGTQQPAAFEAAVDSETLIGPAPGALFPGGTNQLVSFQVAIFVPGNPGDDGLGAPLSLRSNQRFVWLFQKQNDLIPQILDSTGGQNGSYPPINYPRTC